METSDATVLDAKVMIHIRFAPNGSVVEIGERPATLSPQDWFDFLSDNVGLKYQALAGGRGVFRLMRTETDDLKARAVAS
ncbi:MAG TPA: hypothetical protein VL996_10565 [Methylocella sp.]|nr:hypothetical protein [Methylocella sp.]